MLFTHSLPRDACDPQAASHSGRMKFNPALAKSLLMAASIGMVVPLGAQTAPKPFKPPVAPAVPAEEPAKIEGIELARKNGGYLGVTVEGVRLVVKFYDADKKPVPADVLRAAARWNPVNKSGEVRSILNPDASGNTLASTPVVQPPHVFKVYLTLLDVDGNAVESVVVDLRTLNEPKA